MGDFTQRASMLQQPLGKVSATALHELGLIAETADGRVFRYAKAGGTNLAAGKVNVAPAKVANHTVISVAADAAVGARTVKVTVGATAVTSGQYDGGFVVVVDGAGVGQTLKIAGTPAIASAGTGEITLENPLRTALTAASSKVSLQPSVFGGSLVAPAAIAFVPNGVNNVAVPANNYYWSQVGGVASVLSDGIIAKGAYGVLSAVVNGALATEAATGINHRVSVALEATRDTKYDPQYLTLAY
jgi:hypothetical protein